MGFFTSDRCIDEYAEMIWNVEPLPPKDAQTNGA
jgi:glycogen phosphorylase